MPGGKKTRIDDDLYTAQATILLVFNTLLNPKRRCSVLIYNRFVNIHRGRVRPGLCFCHEQKA